MNKITLAAEEKKHLVSQRNIHVSVFFLLLVCLGMKSLPTEVLFRFGTYLNQQEKKTCALVCKHWYNAFSRLVFSKAVFLTRPQITGFLQQDKIKKQLTTSLHLIEVISDDEFKEFVESCPNVKDLTLFVNFTHRLHIPSTVALVSRKWASNLTKIRIDSLLLSEILPLVGHQLTDMTSDFDDLIVGGTGTSLIRMPKLKVLYIENVEDEHAPTMFSRLRAAYPDLVTLTITGALLSDLQDCSALAPFLKLRSFHLTNCDGVTKNAITNVLHVVSDLDSMSLLRSFGNDNRNIKYASIYSYIFRANPCVREVKIDYIYCRYEDTLKSILDMLSSLRQLRSLHIELKCELFEVTPRERVSLLDIITNLPHLRNLTIYGLAHLETVDGLADYLVGKVGHYEYDVCLTESRLVETDSDSCTDDEDFEPSLRLKCKGYRKYGASYYKEDHSGNVIQENSINYVNHNCRHGYRMEGDRIVWGTGEILTVRNTGITACKKKYPDVVLPDESHITWKTSRKFAYNDRYNDQSDFQSALTMLRIEMSTLRNQSYRWINAHCPLLTELHVLQTDIYPWCEIYLADLKFLHTFNWSLEKFYEPYAWPDFQIMKNSRTYFLEWNYGSKTYKESNEDFSADDDYYKVILTLPPSLGSFTVNGYRIDLLTIGLS